MDLRSAFQKGPYQTGGNNQSVQRSIVAISNDLIKIYAEATDKSTKKSIELKLIFFVESNADKPLPGASLSAARSFQRSGSEADGPCSR